MEELPPGLDLSDVPMDLVRDATAGQERLARRTVLRIGAYITAPILAVLVGWIVDGCDDSGTRPSPSTTATTATTGVENQTGVSFGPVDGG